MSKANGINRALPLAHVPWRTRSTRVPHEVPSESLSMRIDKVDSRKDGIFYDNRPIDWRWGLMACRL